MTDARKRAAAISAHSTADELPQGQTGRRGLVAAYLVEQRKLLAQTSTRMAACVCALAPFAFALVLTRQSGVPGDSLLGIWVHSSGYAIGFVVLDFAGYLGFPFLAAVAAGDIFACEDRYGTWKTLLTHSRTRSEVFAAKALVACVLAIALLLLATMSSFIGGLLFEGSQPLVGLGGVALSSDEAGLLLLCSWLLSVPPLLGFVAIAILLSVGSRSGIVGVGGTVIAGLLMQLLGFLGQGTWAHSLLLGAAFDDWHGLLVKPQFFGPLAIALVVSAAWTVAAIGASWLLFRRREFAGPPISRLQGWLPTARLVVLAALAFIALAAASELGSTAITRARLQAAVAPVFERLTILQQRELGRIVPKRSHLNLRPLCVRRSGARAGPGDDWSCTMTLAVAQPGYNPISLTEVTYDVSVKSNGCYKAESPPSFVGHQTMLDAHGRSVVNPLYTIYGCFDTTTTPNACAANAECAPASSRTRAAPMTAAPPALPRSTKQERERQRRQLREAERRAGRKVIKEQEETERYFEHQGAATEAPSG